MKQIFIIQSIVIGLLFPLLGVAEAPTNSDVSSYLETTESSGEERQRSPLRSSQAADTAVSIKPIGSASSSTRAREILLIPESTNDRVMAFDPQTGDLIDENFIPSNDRFSTPLHAILSSNQHSILVSDQLANVILEFDLNGQFMGVFAPKGGANPDILDNIRGITLRQNGHLLVTVAQGANADAVAEFDRDGNYLGNFIEAQSDNLDSPFFILQRETDFLVSGITSDNIVSFTKRGVFRSEFSAIDGFPEQLANARNGNVLAANFIGSQTGIVELTPDGSLVGVYKPEGLNSFRGVFELPNRNLLVTNSSGVFEIDRTGNLIDTKISGVSARFIESIRLPDTELCFPITSTNGRLVTICL